MTTRLDAVLLDASLRQMLVCVRSLGRAGRSVAALDWLPPSETPAFASRWCVRRAALADVAETPDDFVDGVLAFVRRNPTDVLIPAHDGTIEAIRHRRSEIDAKVRVALAPEAALAVAVDKASTLAVASRLGIAVPLSVEVTDTSQVRAALAEVGTPAVAKPLESWVQTPVAATRLRCRDVANAEEALRTVDAMVSAGGRVLLQQWLSGAREAVSFIHDGSSFRAEFAQRALRMDPPLGGSSVVRESVPMASDLARAGHRLVETIGLAGYTEVEFRRDVYGTARLMEINARLSASVEVAVRSGVDFPVLLHRWARGERLPDMREYRTGVRMRWLGGDVHWLASVLARPGRADVPPAPQAIATFIGDFLRPTAYDYVDLHDIRPALIASRSAVKRWVTQGPARLREHARAVATGEQTQGSAERAARSASRADSR
ncbi:MAG: ATP-grasp domain-containing protein [Chloroflexi bacterium]|nr:ATP-grasp domain-containing protein [Chloroflexota bacterium]